jgi:hypothetical protein
LFRVRSLREESGPSGEAVRPRDDAATQRRHGSRPRVQTLIVNGPNLQAQLHVFGCACRTVPRPHAAFPGEPLKGSGGSPIVRMNARRGLAGQAIRTVVCHDFRNIVNVQTSMSSNQILNSSSAVDVRLEHGFALQ